MRRLAIALALTSSLVAACTHDFGVFDTGGKATSGDASAGGGTSNLDGSNGASGRGPSGGASNSGGASAGGTTASTTGGATAASGATSTGGAPSDAGTGGNVATGGATFDAPPCAPSQKLCGLACVGRDSPATGCDSPSCSACSLANATGALCAAGACAPVGCAKGFADCNASRADGCEAVTATDARNCGGCSNDCTQQNGKECISSVCGCTNANECRSGPAQGAITCDTGTNLCHCDAATCHRGESCRMGACSCNGQPACTGAQTCCRTPAGCKDLTADVASCGACGHACATGFVCTGGACACDGDGDCSNGTAGTCSEGVCHCDGGTCTAGQRCLANGKCG